jgi:hypothetical protein
MARGFPAARDGLSSPTSRCAITPFPGTNSRTLCGLTPSPRPGSGTCRRWYRKYAPPSPRSTSARRCTALWAATSSSYLPTPASTSRMRSGLSRRPSRRGAWRTATAPYRRPPRPRTSPGGHSSRPSAASGSSGAATSCESHCYARSMCSWRAWPVAPSSTTLSATPKKLSRWTRTAKTATSGSCACI